MTTTHRLVADLLDEVDSTEGEYTEIVDDIAPVLKISVPKAYGGIIATSRGKSCAVA